MHRSNLLNQRMSRRQFLKTMSLLGAGLAAACSTRGNSGLPTPYVTPTPAHVLGNPQIPATGSTTQAQANEMTLDQFLQLSSLLTGVENLDPELGKLYLQVLQSGGTGGSTLSAAYSAASSGSNTLPKDIEALTKSGFFKQPGVSDLAVQITDMWYSGVYNQNGQDHVATYVDALAWKVLHFTKPPTTCAAFGFWATNPNTPISPGIQYTPVPTPAQSHP